MAAARDMELKLVNGMVLKLQLEEVAGGMGERVAELKAQVAEQGDALNALKRELADMRLRAAGRREKDAAGEAGLGNLEERAHFPPIQGDARDELSLLFAGLKQQMDAERKAARDDAMAIKAELFDLKQENTRLRGAVEAQERAMAYAKETAAHAEARMNDVELGLAELKDRRAGKRPDGRGEGSGEERAAAESREGKRRKREEPSGKEAEMAVAGTGARGRVIIVNAGASNARRGELIEVTDDAEESEEREAREENEENEENEGSEESELEALSQRVDALEATRAEGNKIWEAITTLWCKTVPMEPEMDLQDVSFVSDECLSVLTSFSYLTHVYLKGSSGFTVAGIRQLYSLTSLEVLQLHSTSITDDALEGISRLRSLHMLDIGDTGITDAGVAKLQGLTALKTLCLGYCQSITSASMVHVGRLTGLEWLSLGGSGVMGDGLQHLTSLTSLKHFVLPPGVTDSGMKHLRSLKRLEKLGLWEAEVTAAGIRWLKGLKWLHRIGTGAENVQGFIRDIFPGMVVTAGPL